MKISEKIPKNGDNPQKKTKRTSDKKSPGIFDLDRKKTALILALAFVLILAIGIIKILYSGSDFVIEVAQSETLYKSITVDCCVIRSESYLNGYSGGVTIPLFSDGEKISGNEEYAKVFGNEEAAEAYRRIEKIKEELAYYESVSRTAGLYDTATSVVALVSDSIDDYTDAIYMNDLSSLSSIIKNLRTSISRKQIVNGEDFDCSSKITALENELASIPVPSSTALTLGEKQSGYFGSSCDGYEYLSDKYFEDCESLTVKQIDEILSSEPQTNTTGCKLVNRIFSYIVCNIPSQLVGELKINSTKEICFPDTNAGTIKAKVVSMIPDDSGVTAVVFRTTSISSEIIRLRMETAQIHMQTSENSFRIRKSALHSDTEKKLEYTYSDSVKNEDGDYVMESCCLVDNEYYWIWAASGENDIPVKKRVNIVFYDGDYAIVNNPDGLSNYIRAGERVIVSGKISSAYEKLRKEKDESVLAERESLNDRYNSEIQSRIAAADGTTNS